MTGWKCELACLDSLIDILPLFSLYNQKLFDVYAIYLFSYFLQLVFILLFTLLLVMFLLGDFCFVCPFFGFALTQFV